jgi:GNAT superfamily N-acetyltransferase
MNHSIEIATAQNIPELVRLRYAFRSVLSAPIESETEFSERCETWMTQRLGDGRWYCWIARNDERIIGNVWIQIVEKIPAPTGEPEEHAYLTNFFMLEESRGRGVGSKLMTQALEWCASRRVHAVFLWPTTRTRPLYERHGFRSDGDAMQLLFAPRAK